MGYSHSYGFSDVKTEFCDEELRVVREIADEYKDIIRFEIGIDKPPEITSKVIRLNGIGNQACETFIIKPGTKNDFCKTGQYEYDLPICEILLVIKYFNKDSFRLDSDGFWISKIDAEKFKKSKEINLDGNWNRALENIRIKYGMDFSFNLETTGRDIKYYHLKIE